MPFSKAGQLIEQACNASGHSKEGFEAPSCIAHCAETEKVLSHVCAMLSIVILSG